MNTRRCVYCQAIQRADAQICYYCGRELAEKARPDALSSASSHRAGHTFGLHPEDQPYQSSMMLAQRSPTEEKEQLLRIQQDPNYIVFPPTEELKAQREALRERERALAHQPQPRWRPHFALSPRAVSSLLTLSCIFMLLAASLIAFALVGKRPTSATAVIQVSPDKVRVNDVFTLTGRGFVLHDQLSFYRDNQLLVRNEQGKPVVAWTDAQGKFSVQIPVSADWQVGSHLIHAVDSTHEVDAVTRLTVLTASLLSPSLQISQTVCSFPGAAPGIVSSQSVTLANAGGGQVSWKVSSDQSWLAVTPAQGSFSGSQNVMVSVDRGTLSSHSYAGHLIFTQAGGDGPTVILPVTMSVTPGPASLAVSTTALTYTASNSQDPNDQFITIHNNGQQSGVWSSSISSGDSTNWLSLSPDHDTLAAGGSETVIVSAHSTHLAVGSYQSTIHFDGAMHGLVNVSMSVSKPGNLVASVATLNFSMVAGKVPTGQNITLQNTGGAMVNWNAMASTIDQRKWLQVTPAQGSLAAGEQLTATVTIIDQNLPPGSYQGTISFLTSSGIKQQIAISLLVAAAPISSNPVLNVKPTALNFTFSAGTQPASQTLVLTNAGNTPLQWAIAVNGSNASWVTISSLQGTLAAGQSATLTVSVQIPAQSTGAGFAATLAVSGGIPGSTTLHQNVPISLTATGAVPTGTPHAANTA
ncbi:BACON domain-containing protein [Dictyobacter arantiisoli]|uniref:BACON domain-containing protein n=1 Tax=Dictyobacter arantiisoli TaxID=2014874 RepID=A0A5A5TD00_9CHLR|nr:choice-of-anchor D domain-containing protein [Dictyobacter arantiisoli]GCF09332.1 hypothetical protein KDI_28960 [Dictyobacter arantiisoli]